MISDGAAGSVTCGAKSSMPMTTRTPIAHRRASQPRRNSLPFQLVESLWPRMLTSKLAQGRKKAIRRTIAATPATCVPRDSFEMSKPPEPPGDELMWCSFRRAEEGGLRFAATRP